MYSHASSSETVLRNTKRFMSMRPTCPCFFREGHNFLNLDLTLICTTKEYISNQAFSVTCTFVCICSVTFPPAPTNIKAFVCAKDRLSDATMTAKSSCECVRHVSSGYCPVKSYINSRHWTFASQCLFVCVCVCERIWHYGQNAQCSVVVAEGLTD